MRCITHRDWLYSRHSTVPQVFLKIYILEKMTLSLSLLNQALKTQGETYTGDHSTAVVEERALVGGVKTIKGED